MLIISPHLDDAALSCSLRILERPSESRVVTVFGGTPSEEATPNEWEALTRASSPASRATSRQEEDRAAWSSVGARFEHLAIHEHMPPHIRRGRIAAALEPLLASDDLLLLPAGIGGHPDHVLVRECCLELLSSTQRVVLYGELPYAAYYGWPDARSGLDVHAFWNVALRDLRDRGAVGSPRLKGLSADQVVAKRALVAFYETQIEAISGGSLDMLSNTNLLDFELEFDFEPSRH